MQQYPLVTLVQRYLPECSQQAEQLLALSAVNTSLPNAVVYGVYNSGKSSLLNSLTEQVDPEFFKVRDTRQTRVNQSFEYQGINFIDTPGLDMDEQDTAHANQGAMQADIIIYVHRLSAGSIQKADLAALAKALQHFNAERLLVVFTQAENTQGSEPLIAEVTQQLSKLVCTPLATALVSNTTYKKGVLENKPGLVAASGIVQLREQIQHLAQQLSLQLAQERQEKIARLRHSLLSQVQQARQKKAHRLALMNSAEKAHTTRFVQAVQQTQRTIAEYV